MKNGIVCLAFAFASLVGSAETITNFVYVVSNIYNNVYHESVITQKVKSSHTDYYFTNHTHTVEHQTLIVSQTNLNVNVVNTNFGPWIAQCQASASAAASSASSAQSYSSTAASRASAAASSASSASASAASAAQSAASASSAANNGIATINARIQWFDQHSGETITYVNLTSNVNVTVEQTIVNNTFDDVPYNPDANIKINLNEFALMAKGGTNNYYTISAPSGCRNDSGNSIGIGSFQMRFDRFEILPDRTARFWYKSSYDTGTPYQGNGHTWKFEWAYWHGGVWHVAIRQRRFLSGAVTEDQVFDMTLSAAYPASGSSGTFSNRPSNTWSPSNSSFGKLTGSSSSQTFGFVARIAVDVSYDIATAKAAAVAEAKTYSDGLASSLSGRSDAIELALADVSNRVDAIESGSPHTYQIGGTTYSQIIVYSVAQDNGKVKAVPSTTSKYAASKYRVTPNYRYPTTTASTWEFVPAYVDTDANGMRLQYVPTAIHSIQYSSSASTRFVVPEYLYWQNGYVYCKFRTYTAGSADGSYVIGRVADSTFPDNYTSAKNLTKTEYSGWSATYAGTIVGIGTVATAGDPVWFPATASPSVSPIISWMMTGQ